MSNLRSRLELAASRLAPSTDWLEGSLERVNRRRTVRRVGTAVVALLMFAGSFVVLWGALGPGGQGVPADEPACPRSWSESPVDGPSGGLLSISMLTDEEAWGVGPDEAAPLGSETIIHHLDGTGWQHVPSPNGASGPKAVNALNDVVAIAPDDVWAVGESVESPGWGHNPSLVLVEHWDGDAWTIVPAPSPLELENQLNAVAAAAADDVWAVGFAVADTKATTLIERWDGERWSIVTSPDVTGEQSGAAFYAIEVVSATDIWAGGSQASGGLIEHWDGSTWTVVDIPQPRDHFFVSGIDAATATDVWAVGWSVSGKPVVEHFDGTGWELIDLPPAPESNVVPLAVVAVAANDVWVTGWMGDPDVAGAADRQPLALHWDGGSWSYVDIGLEGMGQVALGAAKAGDTLWFVGRQGGRFDNNGYISGDRPFAVAGVCVP